MGVLSWLVFIIFKLLPGCLLDFSQSLLTFYFLKSAIEILLHLEDGLLCTQVHLMLAICFFCIVVLALVDGLELFFVRLRCLLPHRIFRFGFSEIASLTTLFLQFHLTFPWLAERRLHWKVVFRLNFDWNVWIVRWSIQKFTLYTCDFSHGFTMTSLFASRFRFYLSISSSHSFAINNYNSFTQTIPHI